MELESKKQFIDYYQVLQVWPTASIDVIKKSYFKLAKLYHPDVASKSTDEKKEQEVDFTLINEAFAVLSDPAKRSQFDEELKQRGSVPTEKREADKRSAQLAYEQAKTAMKHNRYDKAAVLLKSAIKYDNSNPAFYSWYGFALAALKTNLHEARDACKKALETGFYNPDFYANLGYVYHQAGLTNKAQECFREALDWDPENAIALRYLYESGKKQKGGLKSILSFLGLSKPEAKQQDKPTNIRSSKTHFRPKSNSPTAKKRFS